MVVQVMDMMFGVQTNLKYIEIDGSKTMEKVSSQIHAALED